MTVARLGERQHGVVTRAQLEHLGVGRGAINQRLEVGRLHPVHRGVYVVGCRPEPLPWPTQAMAAVLASGEGAALSHRSAAALWGVGEWAAPLEVTAPSQHRRRGVRVHRSTTLGREDLCVRRRIPTTSLPRTLVDLAVAVSETRLRRAYSDAQRIHGLTDRSLHHALERSRRAGAVRAIGALIGGPPTRSVLEDRFVTFLRRHRLPMPRVNVRVHGYLVDAVWPDARLVVELDGHEFHRGRVAFEDDRRRDADLLAAGYHVLRITWRRLTEEPEAEAARIRALLS